MVIRRACITISVPLPRGVLRGFRLVPFNDAIIAQQRIVCPKSNFIYIYISACPVFLPSRRTRISLNCPVTRHVIKKNINNIKIIGVVGAILYTANHTNNTRINMTMSTLKACA